MARGDEALAGNQEKDIPSHRFPPDTKSRTIYFKGLYLSIVNQETDNRKTFKENINKYEEYEVPPRYTCYVRGATVYFKI